MNKEVSSQNLFVQVAFFVKHEAVGGQGEVLARCVFQIPDLVAACKYANYLVKLTVNYTNMDGEQIECLVWLSGPV